MKVQYLFTTTTTIIIFVVFVMVLVGNVETYPKKASGFDRLRDRIHRKRHRQKTVSILNETDELYEFSIGEESRIRLEASVITTTNAPLSTTVAHHHKHKHKKNHRKEKNEELCQSQRKTVELNTHSHEFDPPFIVEVRCLNTRSPGIFGIGKQEQTCVKGMLRCVQQYSDIHVSRRSVDSLHWHPHTIPDVPISCQCMWPVDKYGHQDL